MLALIAAVLALTGAPVNTQVVCGAQVPSAEQGWTWWNTEPPQIMLGAAPCQAILYAAATPAERVKIQQLNPTFGRLAGATGAGLLIFLHEAVHAAGNHDEASTECEALRLLPGLLNRVGLTTAERREADLSAAAWDRLLPDLYHQQAC